MKTFFLLIISFLSFSTLAIGQVGIGTLSPNSTMDIKGSLAIGYRAFSSSYTLTDTDCFVVYTGVVNATVTLPSAVGCDGRSYTIKNIGSGLPVPAVTINAISAQLIEGQTNWVLNNMNEVITLISTGSNWVIAAQSNPISDTAAVVVSGTSNTWSTLGNAGTSYTTHFMGTTDGASLRFRTNNTQRMVLDSVGNFGIGTNNPGNLVEINSGTPGLSGLRIKQLPAGAVLYSDASGDLVQNTGTLYVDAANNKLSVGAGISPNSTLTVGGSISLPVITKTANYTIAAENYTTLCNSNTGGFTITLPAAAGCAGRVYVIKKISTDGNLIVLHAGGTSDLIDGSVNQYLYAAYSYFTIQSDGVNTWNIIAQH